MHPIGHPHHLSIENITSTDTFVDYILHSVLASEPVYGADNIDSAYPAAGFGPGAPDPTPDRTAYFRFVLNNAARFYDTLSFLEDTASRELFVALILFRVLGFRRVRLPVDHDAYRAAREAAGSLPCAESCIGTAGFDHYELLCGEKNIRLDCLSTNIFFTFGLRQYYFQRPGIRIAPREGDTVIDAGACYGDTAIHFASTVGPTGHVCCFEALGPHLDILRLNLRQNPELTNITVFPCALSDRDRRGEVPDGECNPGFRVPETAPSHTLDFLVADRQIQNVDFIKMDIEGSEMAALTGAAETIRCFRPRLAISVYHAPDDYFRIPALIRDLCAGYRLFLDNHTISDGETILYATCE